MRLNKRLERSETTHEIYANLFLMHHGYTGGIEQAREADMGVATHYVKLIKRTQSSSNAFGNIDK